jgi:hypothetical protein
MTRASETSGRSSRGTLSIVVLIIAAAVITAAWGILTREHAMAELSRETREMAVTTGAVQKQSKGTESEDVALPGSVQAYTVATRIFARTTGYLKKR